MPVTLPTSEPAPSPGIKPDLRDPDHLAATFLGILQGDDYIGNAVRATPDTEPISPVAPPTVAPGVVGNVGIDDPEDVARAPLSPTKVDPQPDSNTPAAYGGDNLHSGSWAHDLLSMLGLPITYENVRALTAWQKAEGGGSDGPSHSNFNWLNTTRKLPGQATSNINTVGVKSFSNYHDGLAATAAALTNGLYGNILAALAQGNSALAVARAIESSPWGTGGGVLAVLGSK
jgi:hypothetical protein